ncbi:hypothetical protein GW17_00043726 [Ensete ventricosum]|nr:hypothetical protein GW17_00043726 [Ensete ventricosum]
MRRKTLRRRKRDHDTTTSSSEAELREAPLPSCLGPLLLLLSPRLPTLTLANLRELPTQPWVTMSTVVTGSTFLVAMSRPRPVYLVDFFCDKPSQARMATCSKIMDQFRSAGTFTDETVAFQRKMLERCGIGDSSYFPRSLLCIYR